MRKVALKDTFNLVQKSFETHTYFFTIFISHKHSEDTAPPPPPAAWISKIVGNKTNLTLDSVFHELFDVHACVVESYKPKAGIFSLRMRKTSETQDC